MTEKLLQIAPRPYPGEAVSFWLKRVAARHMLDAWDILDWLEPSRKHGTADVEALDLSQCVAVDYTVGLLEKAARLPSKSLQMLRDPAVQLWPRRFRPILRCQKCIAGDLQNYGEIYERSLWLFAGATLCPIHHCELTSNCPKCSMPTCEIAFNGYMQLVCNQCGWQSGNGTEHCSIPSPSSRPPELCLSEPYKVSQLSAGDVQISPSSFVFLLEIQNDLATAARGAIPTGPLSGAGLSGLTMLGTWTALARLALSVLCRSPQGTLLKFRKRGGLGFEEQYFEKDWTPGFLKTGVLEIMAATAALVVDAIGQPQAGIFWRPGHPAVAESFVPVCLLGLLPPIDPLKWRRERLRQVTKVTSIQVAVGIRDTLRHKFSRASVEQLELAWANNILSDPRHASKGAGVEWAGIQQLLAKLRPLGEQYKRRKKTI